jgi:hypothetical protein
VLKVDSSLLNYLTLKQEKSEQKDPSVRGRAPSIYLPFASTSPKTQQAGLNHCNISFSVERISYPLPISTQRHHHIPPTNHAEFRAGCELMKYSDTKCFKMM